MINKELKAKLDFIFECERCMETWSENLLDLIDRCSSEELLWLLKHIQNKVEKSSDKK